MVNGPLLMVAGYCFVVWGDGHCARQGPLAILA